jgi:predicted exporter
MKSKTNDKAVKPTKTNINFKNLVKRFIAKPLAYVTLFVLASYGMRQMLRTIDSSASTVLTILAVLALVYILFIDD